MLRSGSIALALITLLCRWLAGVSVELDGNLPPVDVTRTPLRSVMAANGARPWPTADGALRWEEGAWTVMKRPPGSIGFSRSLLLIGGHLKKSMRAHPEEARLKAKPRLLLWSTETKPRSGQLSRHSIITAINFHLPRKGRPLS